MTQLAGGRIEPRTRPRSDAAAGLGALAGALAAADTAVGIATALIDRGLAMLGADAGALATLSPDGNAIEIVRAVGYPGAVLERMQHLELEAPFALAAAARTGAPVWLAGREAIRAGFPGSAPLALAAGSQAHAVLPLVAEGRVLGVLALGFVARRHFGQQERAYLTAAAQICASAWKRARLYERGAGLQAVTAALGRTMAAADVADVVLDEGLAALGARGGVVSILSTDGQALEILSARGYPPEILEPWRRTPLAAASPNTDAARSGEPVLLGSPEERMARYPTVLHRALELGHRAVAVYPLVVDGRALGALTLTWAESRVFGDEDRDLLGALAQQCAQALERARLHREVEEAVRARDEFIAIAAHDLRTPIASMRGHAQLLRRLLARGEADPARVAAAAANIEQQTGRLTELIGRLLDVARLDGGGLALEHADTDVAALVEELVGALQRAHPERMLVVRAPEPVPARVDPVRLRQVVTNLVDNALKFSPAPAPVEVEVGAPTADTLRIAVRDQGPGVPAEQRARLFERFYRGAAERDGGGLGLGLYISRAIVAQHGGTIAVETPEDGGARFVVLLPRGLGVAAAPPIAVVRDA